MKCLKVQNRLGVKLIETLQDQVDESILPKRLKDTALHNIMESIRRKIGSLINIGSNKVCIVSLTKFYNYIKFTYLNNFLKINKKGKMLMTKHLNFVGGLRQRIIRYHEY